MYLSGGHGFLLSKGVFTTIDFPRARGTVAVGIDNGFIVGVYSDKSFRTHGFMASLRRSKK